MWVEAEPLAKFRETDVIRFVRRNILSRFDILKAFISYNETQLMGKKLKTCWSN